MHEFANATGAVLNAGRRVVVYSGKNDFICNYIGGSEWTNATRWNQQVRPLSLPPSLSLSLFLSHAHTHTHTHTPSSLLFSLSSAICLFYLSFSLISFSLSLSSHTPLPIPLNYAVYAHPLSLLAIHFRTN